MSKPGLTTEMQQFIARTQVGSPLEIYSPTPVGPMILIGITMFGFIACAGISALTGRSIHYPIDPDEGLNMAMFAFLFTILSIVPAGILIMVTFSNRKKRAVICTSGVAFLLYQDFGSFRWQDVLTTTRQSGSKTDLTYTVYCHDGRRIVFNGFIGMYMLAEAIDVQVARARQPSLSNHNPIMERQD